MRRGLETITLGELVARLNTLLSIEMRDAPILMLLEDDDGTVIPIRSVSWDASMQCYVLWDHEHETRRGLVN